MAGGALLAYPLLLGAVYGVFRVGRREGLARRSRLEWLRLATLSVFLVVITILQVRFAAAGVMSTSWAVFVGVASLASALGLVGLHGFEMIEAWDRAKRPHGEASAAPGDG